MRGAIRTFVQPWLWRGYRWYYSQKRNYRFEGLTLRIFPTVFHPGLFLTTHSFLKFIRELPIAGKKVLELGAGSGLIALWCARAGARVTASDINLAAVEGIVENAAQNGLTVQTVLSDLFDSFESEPFDYIFINPPFYPKAPQNDQERAFFCGENFEYFEKLFRQLPAFVHAATGVYLILTDDCDLARIQAIGGKQAWTFEQVTEQGRMGEVHFVYRLEGRRK